VIQIHQPDPDGDSPSVVHPRPSRQLVRRILVQGHHGIGQRVLVAGTGCDELTGWLDDLGFEVETWGSAALELTKSLPSPSTFDLILVDDLHEHRGNLLELNSRLVTARLLTCLKPGGDLVVIRDAAFDAHGVPTTTSTHDAVCWTRHLACFPGRLETAAFPAPWISQNTLSWLLGRGSLPPELAVSLRIPTEPLMSREWQEHARRGLLTGTNCCRTEAVPLSPARRAA